MEDEDEADLDDGSEGDQDTELSLVHGIRPLASTADMEVQAWPSLIQCSTEVSAGHDLSASLTGLRHVQTQSC